MIEINRAERSGDVYRSIANYGLAMMTGVNAPSRAYPPANSRPGSHCRRKTPVKHRGKIDAAQYVHLGRNKNVEGLVVQAKKGDTGRNSGLFLTA